MQWSPMRLQQPNWLTHSLRWCSITGFILSVTIWVFGLLLIAFTNPISVKGANEVSNVQAAVTAQYGAAAVVGEPLEPCDTQATIPGASVLLPSDDWETALQTASPGTTFLLHGGTYAATKKLRVNAGQTGQFVTVKPYNCEAVILQGSFKPLSYTVLAGLHIEGASLPTTNLTYVIQVDADGKEALRNLVIRNNTIVGGETDALRINGDVVGLTLTGNKIDGGKDGHDIFVTTQTKPINPALSPDNITVTNNLLTKVYFRTLGTTSEDMFQVRDARHVIFAHNTCTNGSRMEQCVDIKDMTVPITIQYNLFDGTNLQLDGKGEDKSSGCMVIHEMDGHPENHLIEYNYFKNCRTTVIRFATEGDKANSSGIVRHNLFLNSDSTDEDGLLLWRAQDVLFENNTMIRGTLKLGRGDGLRSNPPITPKNTTLKNNIFYQTRIDDNTQAPNFVYACRYNLLFDVTEHGDYLLNCTQSLTSAPLFTAQTTEDYQPELNSPTCGSGENGTDLGAIPCTGGPAANTPIPTNTPIFTPLPAPTQNNPSELAPTPTTPATPTAVATGQAIYLPLLRK